MKGILGRKAGMTTIFTEEGKAIPITVIEVPSNVVLQVKTKEVNGYNSIKLGAFDKKEQKSIKPETGITKKAKSNPKYFVKEIKNMKGFGTGDIIDATIFESGEYVDVTGVSKGKGFQGSIKRHNQSRGPMGHGSKSHRVTGSSGDIRSTVKKTKKMPGHMGHEKTTMQNLVIVLVDIKNNSLLIRGSIPGPNKSFVIVRDSIKLEHNSNPINLVDVKINMKKNELLEEGKKYKADISTKMKIDEMEKIIFEAKEIHEKEAKELEELLNKAKELKITNYEKMNLAKLRATVNQAKDTTSSETDNKEGAK